MENLPTGWRGQALALSLAALVLAMAYVVVVAPLLGLYADRGERAETQRELLVKLNDVAAELPLLHAKLSELRSAAQSSKLTLEGASDAIALAALQSRIEGLATSAGITIGSTEGLPAETQGAYRRLGLRLVVSGPYASLIKLLAAIETSVPPVVIDNLQIHSLQRRAGTAPVNALDASIEVYGFRTALGSGAGRS